MGKSTVLLLFISLAFSLIAAEFAARLFFEPLTVYDPNLIADDFRKFNYSSNKLGFREEEITDKIFHSRAIRILFLGDSFTWGHGVDLRSDRFSDILESQLNSEPNKNNFTYNIFNAGKEGTNPKEWTEHLTSLMPIYKPQHVFAIFFLRDGTDLCTSLLCYKDDIIRIKSRYENAFWYRYTSIGKIIGNRLIKRDFSEYYKEKIINAYFGTEKERKPWIESQKNLIKLNSLCKNEGITFHIIIFPLLYGLESEYEFYDVDKEIMDFAKKNEIRTYSLTEGFIGQESETLWVSKYDQHPNEKGNMVAAKTLLPYLKEAIFNNMADQIFLNST